MNIARSLEFDSPTVMIDVETGERVAHWLELDKSSRLHLFDYPLAITLSPASWLLWLWTIVQRTLANFFFSTESNSEDALQTLLIFPAKRLRSGRRYIVAIRSLFREPKESSESSYHQLLPLQPSLGFKFIRDNFDETMNLQHSNVSSVLQKRLLHFQERNIFSILKSSNVERETLILAWDFTVASAVSTTEHLLFMRDDATNRIKNANFPYNITRVDDNYSENIYRRIDGYFLAPSYLTGGDFSAESKFSYDLKRAQFSHQLHPKFHGWRQISFTIWIPRIALLNSGVGTASILQYGHGLFSSRNEAGEVHLQMMANSINSVIVSIDWLGLCRTDLVTMFFIIFSGRVDALTVIFDRISQGIVNQLLLTEFVVSSALRSDPQGALLLFCYSTTIQ